MAALQMQSCSAVQDSDLDTVTKLTITAETVSAEDVAGLTAITDLELELNNGLNAHLAALTTLRRAEITINLPTVLPEEEYKADEPPWGIPEDFLPPKFLTRFGTYEENTFAGFDHLRFNISPGFYPIDIGLESLGLAILDRRFQTKTLHLRDESERSSAVLTRGGGHGWISRGMAPQITENLVIELRPRKPRNGPTLYLYEDGLNPGDKVQSFTLVNLNPEVKLSLPDDAFPRRDALRHLKYVEIRGNLEIDRYALQVLEAVEELHLDPESDGDPHHLYIWRKDVDGEPLPPPTGTGFVLTNR